MNVHTGTVVEPASIVHSFIARDHALYINGRWEPSRGSDKLDIFDPATGCVIAKVAKATPVDVDDAVAAAAAAFADGRWAGLPPVVRERILLRFADLIETHAEELAQIETLNQGKSINITRMLDLGFSVAVARFTAGLVTKMTGQTMDVSIPIPPGARHTAYTRREPLGVVAAIAPWNFPVMIALWKVLPALAAGCTVVLKPSELTPLTALRLAEIATDAGIPAGVLNVITGDGSVTGNALASHPRVAKISFTGSVATGKKLGHVAMDRMARSTLELGGKNPAIFLEDTPIEKMVGGAILGGFLNSGQVCAAASRLYVARSKYATFVDALTAAVKGMSIGPGLDQSAQITPVVSRAHQDKVLDHVRGAERDGARVVTGGRAVERPGYFVEPTVIVDATPTMGICRNEVFGPVVTVAPFDSVDEVVAFANDSDLGLTASVWSNDLTQVMSITTRLQAGMVYVNTHNVLDATLPFGGFKQSGIGRDFGTNYLDPYTEIKSVVIAY